MYYNQIVQFVMGYDFINLCICNTLPKALVTYGKPQKCWIKTFLWKITVDKRYRDWVLQCLNSEYFTCIMTSKKRCRLNVYMTIILFQLNGEYALLSLWIHVHFNRHDNFFLIFCLKLFFYIYNVHFEIFS